MPPQVAEGAPQLPKVGAPTPGAPGAGPKVGGALAARMAMLQLDPTKMNPQAVADHQKIMREKEMARMEAELKAANERRDEEMERIGRKKSVGAPGSTVMKPGEAAPGQLVHAKKPKMAGRGNKKAAPVRKIKFENKEQERPNVLREIQGDEMLFVQDLAAVVEKFHKPILNRTPGKFGIPPDQWDVLKKILVMKSFHERLSAGPLMQQKVGDSFRDHKEELLGKHRQFQQDFVSSLRVFHALRLSPAFALLLTQLAAGHPPLRVPSAYTKPMGRYHEYRQLVERLLNCTNETNEEGEANKEYGLLKDALAWLKAADKETSADYLQAEDSARLLELQHSEIKTPGMPRDFTFFKMGRRIIRTDDMLPKGTHDPLKVYLCNDVVMWFTPQGVYKGHAPLRDITLANEAEVIKRLNEEDRTDDAKGEIKLVIRASPKTSGKCVFNPHPQVDEEEDEKEEVKQEHVEPTPKQPEPVREEKKDSEPPVEAKKPVPTAANSAMAGAGAMAAAAMAAKKQGAVTKTPPGPPAGGPKPAPDANTSEPGKVAEPEATAKPPAAEPPKDERGSTAEALPKSQSQGGGLTKSQSIVGDAETIQTPSASAAPRKYKGPSFNPAPAVTAPATVTDPAPKDEKPEDPTPDSRESGSRRSSGAVAPPLPLEGPPPPPPPPPSAEPVAGGKEVNVVLQCLTIRLEDKWCKAFIRAKLAYVKAPTPDIDEEQAKFDANVRTMVSQSGGCCAIS